MKTDMTPEAILRKRQWLLHIKFVSSRTEEKTGESI